MQDIDAAILHAWDRIRPRLEDEPALLAQRLRRRATPTLTRPPRAWCIALRASDHRLGALSAIDHPTSTSSSPPHTITLTADDLQQLCQPVHLSRDYLDEAAQVLGTTPMGLTNARIAGVITARHIPLLGGRRGKPIPMLSTAAGVDPNANLFANPDRAWSWTAFSITARIPQDLCVTLERVAHFRSDIGRHRYDDDRHPELDAVPPPGKRRQLPPPDDDPTCWYKWSRVGDYYLGDDPTNWRKSPDDLGDRPPRYLPKRRQKRRPRPSRSQGSLHFNGYFWLCPACGRKVRKLYYPLPPVNLLKDVPTLAKLVGIPRKLSGFACHRCHNVRFFTRLGGEAWNQLIAYLTRGLLYGREVERPPWFTADRKRPYKPHSQPRPAIRRRQVLDRLLQGHPRARIAAELRMSIAALTGQINKIYKSERVRGQRALLLKHHTPLPPRLVLQRHRILDHLRKGQLPDEIAKALCIRQSSVERHIRELRRRGELPRRQSKRQKVATLHAAGLTRHQIAERLHMTPQSVSTRLCELRQAANRSGSSQKSRSDAGV